MIEATLPIPFNDTRKDEMLRIGFSRFMAKDYDHPAAKLFVAEDIRERVKFEQERATALAGPAGELTLQLVLPMEVEAVIDIR